MNDIKYWLAFSKIYSIGTILLNRMLEHCGSLEESWHAPASDLLNIEGFSSTIIEKFIKERNSIPDLNKLEDIVLSKDIKIITLHDENYPYYLKQIYDPPLVLYVKGSLESFNQEKCLAVVGSRKASHYIKEVLKKIISGLKEQNITIASGMAIGVDTCAHQAALDNDINTVAVIGSGFDFIYPAQNKTLYRKIIEAGGAVISEYFPDQQAQLWTFPRRNRIISGLSQGTLVGEAGLKSGALITAKLCLDQNRELMCIPGMVTNPNTEGTYKLIKEGAAVVTETEDIFNQLGWEAVKVAPNLFFPSSSVNSFTINQKNSLNESNNNNYNIESKIYDIIDFEPKSFDEILQESGVNIDELMMILTTFELTGAIKQLPGQQFVKNL